jgi:hypothetical protein
MTMTGFRRAYGHFQADIEDFVTTSEKRMIALMRASIQDVVLNAQQPVGKGGRMRVDTGFLRASGQSSLNGMPSGPTRGELTAPGSYEFNPNTVQVTLGNMQIGVTFHFGWTANYARYRELYDGFLEGSLQNWGRIVAFNTDDMRQRIKK